MISKRLLSIFTASALIALSLLTIRTQPVQGGFLCVWTGAASTAWNDPGNWTGCNGVIPQAADTASITKVAAKPSPVLNGSTTITRLDVNPSGALIAVSGATLTANIVNMNGRFGGPGNILVLNTFNWGGVAPGDWLNDGILDNGGKITIQSSAHGYLSGYSQYYRLNNFTLENHGILEPLAGYQYAYVEMDHGVIDNYGTFSANGSFFDIANNSTIYNRIGATLQATDYSLLYTAVINDGVVNVINTEMYICRGSDQNGEFKGTGNGFILFGYCFEGAIVPTTFNFSPTSKLTVPRIQFGLPGNVVNIHGTYGPIGTTTISYLYGTVTFHSDATINSFGDTLNSWGLTTVNANAPLNQYNLATGGNFIYSGTINITHEFGCGGTVSGGGLLRVKPGGILRIGGCTLDNKQVENQGDTWWSGGNVMGLNDSLLDNSGTFNILAGSLMSGSMTFKNHGTINKNNPSTTTIDMPFENYGEIKILQGQIVFPNEVILPAGTTNVITGTLQVGELINEGTLTVNGTVDGDLTNHGTLSLSGTVTGDLVNEYRMSPGSSPGLAIVGGDFTQTAAGSLQIELSKAGSVPVIHPVAGVDYDRLQVAGSAFISGELYLVAGDTLALASFAEFPFISAVGGVKGTFLTQYLDDMIPTYLWSLVYRPNDISIRLVGFTYLPVISR